jgi:hypothetical protein
MNPCEMTAKQIVEALGVKMEDVSHVTARFLNKGGYVMFCNGASMSWSDPADFARLVEARRVKPWQNERYANEDDKLARRVMIDEQGDWLDGLWRSISGDGLTPSVLARIGFRKVMADIAGKGGPEKPGELTVRELHNWMRRPGTACAIHIDYQNTWKLDYPGNPSFKRGLTIETLTELVRGG